MEEVEKNLSLDEVQNELSVIQGGKRKKSYKELMVEATMAKIREDEEKSAGKISRDAKGEMIAKHVINSHLFTNVMINEEVAQSYYKIPNVDGEVAAWQPIPRNGVDTVILNMLAYDDGKSLPCKLPAVAKNAKMIADTILCLDTKDVSVREKGKGLTLVHEQGAEGDGLYFSWDQGVVERDMLEISGEHCFRRFFDGSNVEKGVRELLENTNGEYEEKLVFWAERAHKEGLTWLRTGKGYDIRFNDTFMAWADGDAEIYMDLLTMSCMPLIKRKAEKAFFLLGEKANGKSVYRTLLREIYGPKNCATVQMNQIGDWSYAATLDGKILNFPDEENTKVENFDISSFKTMATHGDMVVRRKGSSYPLPLKCDFISISPINSSIDWDNIDGGVASRVQIIPFTHDFSSERASGEGGDWCTRRYTPEFCLEVLGELMGLAWAYNEWTDSEVRRKAQSSVWHWSTIANNMSDSWVEEHKNISLFIKEFREEYVGYQSLTLLYECYKLWVDTYNAEHGTDLRYEQGGRKALKDACLFARYNTHSMDSKGGAGVTVRQGEKRTISGNCLTERTQISVPISLLGGSLNGTTMRPIRDLMDLGISPIQAKRAGKALDDKEIVETVQRLF